MNEAVVLLFVAAVFGLTVVPIVLNAFFVVKEGETAVVHRLGRFQREAGPGLHVLLPFLERVVGHVNMRVQQLDVEIECRTRDDVLVRMVVAVHYSVLPGKACDAFYEGVDARRRITAFVSEVVWARVPKIALRDLFEATDRIADAARREGVQAMEGVSYQIIRVLVTSIDVHADVVAHVAATKAALSAAGGRAPGGRGDDLL
jgi:regulator of protease activity HflC (stomatin/prohibitin superfamily)